MNGDRGEDNDGSTGLRRRASFVREGAGDGTPPPCSQQALVDLGIAPATVCG